MQFKKRAMTFDIQSYDLATSFLSDSPAIDNPLNREALAIAIQETIEDFLNEKEALEGKKPDA